MPFEPNMKAVRHLFGGMRVWLKLEAETMFVRPAEELPQPAMSTPKARMAEVS
jgi:hypothetical protein